MQRRLGKIHTGFWIVYSAGGSSSRSRKGLEGKESQRKQGKENAIAIGSLQCLPYPRDTQPKHIHVHLRSLFAFALVFRQMFVVIQHKRHAEGGSNLGGKWGSGI